MKIKAFLLIDVNRKCHNFIFLLEVPDNNYMTITKVFPIESID